MPQPNRSNPKRRDAEPRLPIAETVVRPTFRRERRALAKGVWPVAGCDEAGRGPLAGPVVAAAVLLCEDGIAGLDDSKKLTAKRRGELEILIKARCRWGVGEASVAEIDRINILQATFLAMTRAVEALGFDPHEVLVDGNRLPKWRYSARAIVGGDALHPCISAASIIAKEHRDRFMVARFPASPASPRR